MKTTEIYYKTIRHFFGKSFFKWMGQIPDWRDAKRIKYTVQDLMATGLSIFLLKLGSRHRLNEERGRDKFDQNGAGMFDAQGLAHGDSLNYFLVSLDWKHLHGLLINCLRHLIRNKVLDQFRMLGYFLVAFDGTGYLAFGQRHCAECLSRRLENGEVIYLHPVLEAKLICSNGMVFSLGTEFLRNSDGERKQDCELKAFYRLVKRVKKDFPQLRICLLGDGLYAGEPTFSICKEYEWGYIIVLKDNDLATVWEEVKGLRTLQKENWHRRQTILPNGKVLTEKCVWTTDIEYRDHTVHVLEYEETIECKKVCPCRGTCKGKKASRWAWITNLKISSETCLEIACGGRLRWKEENEGFNIQKNHGYELEHAYSYNFQAQTNFYLLMQIAHLLNQLVEKGNLLLAACSGRRLSLKGLVLELVSQIKQCVVPWEEWRKADYRSFQIRFDTS